MRFSTSTLIYLAAAACLAADEPAIPLPVSAANYPSLLERPPFRQVIRLSRSLVLSGVASRGVALQFVGDLDQLRPGVRLLDGTQVDVVRTLCANPQALNGE